MSENKPFIKIEPIMISVSFRIFIIFISFHFIFNSKFKKAKKCYLRHSNVQK